MPWENYDDTTHSPTVSCNSVRLTMHPPKLMRSYRTPGPAWSGQQYLSLFLTCCTPCSMTVECKCFTLPVELLLVAIRPTCLQFRMSNVCAAVRLNERQKGRERGDDSEGGHMDGSSVIRAGALCSTDIIIITKLSQSFPAYCVTIGNALPKEVEPPPSCSIEIDGQSPTTRHTPLWASKYLSSPIESDLFHLFDQAL